MKSHRSKKDIERKRKKAHDKTNARIRLLFQQMRRNSQSSHGSSKTVNPMAGHDVETAEVVPQKRQLELENDPIPKKQRRRGNSSCVIIDDDDVVTNNEICNTSTPIKAPSKEQCSTPIRKDSKVNDVIVSNISGIKFNNNSITSQNFNEEVTNLTKQINADSYLTIDLTNESSNSTMNKTANTVIDLANQTDNDDCTVISVSDANLSMSGESDVTVLNMSHNKEKKLRKFTRGIAKLDASEKDRLLELITQNIFSGCSAPKRKRAKQFAVCTDVKVTPILTLLI